MSDPKQETREDPTPDAVPPEYETFRKSSEWDISGRMKDLEIESVRFKTLQANFATKNDLRDVKDELSKEITGLAEKLTTQIIDSSRHSTNVTLGVGAILAAFVVLALYWLWDMRDKIPDASVAPAAQVSVAREAPIALPPQATPAVTYAPARKPPPLVAESTPATSAPESGPPETERTEG
ncbi:MAG: hypothetical protein LBT40_08190 [Deltaproteobacteria bacterium]|jgi:hypothetical protein|nr:hypothetical protein [Deltaproteobacteria bacterium]